jgi:hypothetical protein
MDVLNQAFAESTNKLIVKIPPPLAWSSGSLIQALHREIQERAPSVENALLSMAL